MVKQYSEKTTSDLWKQKFQNKQKRTHEVVSHCVWLAGRIYVVSMYGQTYSKSMDQPGRVASPARGQLNRKNEYFPVRVSNSCLRIWSRKTYSAVPYHLSLLISILLRLNLVRDSSQVPRRRPFIHL